jgi:hypothetical protein
MIISTPEERQQRVFSLTWPQPLRRWGKWELQVLFWAARHIPPVSRPLREMAIIRAAYWTILTRVPDGNGGLRRLRKPVLYFDASFDVDLPRYIELFAESLRWRFRALWSSGTGYPGVLPADGFVVWVDENRVPPTHYWCAYPEATTRMVRSGLRVSAAVAEFEAATAHLDDDKFAAEFERLLARVANDL